MASHMLQGEKMKTIILLLSVSLCSVTEFNITNNDTTNISKFYKSGKIKLKGMKVNKFKEGKWIYYTKNGAILKIEEYKNGRKTKNFKLGALNE